MDFAFRYLTIIPSRKWIHCKIFSKTKLSAGRGINTSIKVLQKINYKVKTEVRLSVCWGFFFFLYKARVFIALIQSTPNQNSKNNCVDHSLLKIFNDCSSAF